MLTKPKQQPIQLASETRSHLTTAQAAPQLGRQQQTMRRWACMGDGPIQPVRVHGRLMWPTDAIRAVLGVERAA